MSEPKKSMGQHWLYDADTLQNICDVADISSSDTVLEIGPGLGTLTERLLATGAKIIAVEFDKELLGPLRAKFNYVSNFELVHADILNFNLNDLPQSYKIVANIPYYLSSHLLRILGDATNMPSLVVLLMQKEVTRRVCAVPPNMSILSVAVQIEFDASLGMFVPAALFTPPPKVDSQVLILHKKTSPFVPSVSKKAYLHVVKAGFSSKRKTLRNTISSGLQLTKPQAELLLQKSTIDPTRRAETVTLAEWHELYKQSLTR